MIKFSEFIKIEKIINEMSISAKRFSKATSKIEAYLNRSLNAELVMMDEVDEFENAEGQFKGIRYFFKGSTNCIRLNFSKDNRVVSVDYWGSDGGHVPTLHIKFPESVSLVQILPTVVDIIKNEKRGEFYADIKTGRILDVKTAKKDGNVKESTMLSEKKVTIGGKEYNTQQEAAIALFKAGKQYSEVEEYSELSPSSIFYAAKRLGIAKPVISTSGLREKSIGKDIKNAEQQFADPKVIFKDLEKLVTMVAKGAANSLIILGQSGIGKTYTVMETVKAAGLKEGVDYTVVKGFSTAAGMYRTLYENKEQLVIYDDADAVFKDPNGVNILKAALDSYDTRVLTWSTMRSFDPEGMTADEIRAELDEGRLPRKFEFEGRVIFISNLPKHKMDKALLTRVIAAPDITLKNEDILKRMEDILPNISPEVAMSLKREVFNHLQEASKERTEQLSIRTLVNSIKFANFGNTHGVDDWKGLINRHA